jgi:FtsZ-interacting cell division protein ZipA
MSDLQLSLILVGLLVIAAVYMFNRMQEQRYRRKFEESFDRGQEDVLLSDGTVQREAAEIPSEPRIEPSLSDEVPTADEELSPVPQEPNLAEHAPSDETSRVEPAADTEVVREPVLAAGPDAPDIDFRARLEGGSPLGADLLSRLEKQLGGIGKPVRIDVRTGADGPWLPAAECGAETGSAMKVALQLADRGGPASTAQLARFREIVESIAEALGATASFDDEGEALERASEIDGFCAENDVAIGLNIIPQDVTGLAGTKLRALAEASGFTLAADGSFHLSDEHGTSLIALTSMDGVPFEAGSIKTLRSQGVTLLIDVTRVAEGRQIFQRMNDLARKFATALNGTVVDDKRNVLNPASLEKIASQIDAIQSALKARGIPPGSPLALRLFS